MCPEKNEKAGSIAPDPTGNKPTSSENEVLEIEPDIMVDGKVHYEMDTAEIDTLVIHCADPRFQTAFRRFITEELGIASYTPIIIGGGIHAFGIRHLLPKNFKILWEPVSYTHLTLPTN